MRGDRASETAAYSGAGPLRSSYFDAPAQRFWLGQQHHAGAEPPRDSLGHEAVAPRAPRGGWNPTSAAVTIESAPLREQRHPNGPL